MHQYLVDNGCQTQIFRHQRQTSPLCCRISKYQTSDFVSLLTVPSTATPADILPIRGLVHARTACPSVPRTGCRKRRALVKIGPQMALGGSQNQGMGESSLDLTPAPQITANSVQGEPRVAAVMAFPWSQD
jgi:hypothetical protein